MKKTKDRIIGILETVAEICSYLLLLLPFFVHKKKRRKTKK